MPLNNRYCKHHKRNKHQNMTDNNKCPHKKPNIVDWLVKTNLNLSSFLFNDKILGWAGYENSKKRFKSKTDLWTLQSTFNWANKKINQNKENKKENSKIMIDKFFQLSNIKKTKINFSLNHGWKYSSNSKPFKSSTCEYFGFFKFLFTRSASPLELK